MKDRNGSLIKRGDIIVWGYSRDTRVAYIWDWSKCPGMYEGDKGLKVGFDVRGPSCEDSVELDEFFESWTDDVQVIGKLKDY